MTCAESWGLIIQGAGVITSLFLAFLAIWGDSIRHILVGPKLRLSLHDPQGITAMQQDGVRVRYYHLRVRNSRTSLANNVRVMLTGIKRETAPGQFADQPMSAPLLMQWQYHEAHPQFATIGPDDYCDIGFASQQDHLFHITTGITPISFLSTIGYGATQKAQLTFIAQGDNAISEPITVEISNDGKWSEDAIEMQNHVSVRHL